MLTSLPSPTVELQAKHRVSFSLDNLRASASKLWHVIVPVLPVDSVAAVHFTLSVTLIQHLFFECTSWTVLGAAHGFIWNHAVAALPRHSCLELELREAKQKEKIFKFPVRKNDGDWCIYPLFLAKKSVRKTIFLRNLSLC